MRHIEQNSCLRQSAQRAGYWSFLGGTFQHPSQPALAEPRLAQSQPMTRCSSRGSQTSLTSSQGSYESDDVDPDTQSSEVLPQQFQITSQYMDSVNYHQPLSTHLENSEMLMQQPYLQPMAEQAVSQSHNAAYDFLGHNLPGTALVDPIDSQIDYNHPPLYAQTNQPYHAALHSYVDYDIMPPPNIQSAYIPPPTYYQPPVDSGEQLIYIEQPNLTGQTPTLPYGGVSYGY